MTPQEFKAWFEGFTEALTATPTKAQWTRIKERVADIDGKPVTERVFVDRYWHHWQQPGWTYLSCTNAVAGAMQNNSPYQSALQNGGQNATAGGNFDSMQSMTSLGRYEASNLQ